MTTDFESLHPRADAGKFDAKTQTTPEISSLTTRREQRVVLAAVLQPGDVMISGDGKSRITVVDIERSNVIGGTYAVETSLGTIYLPDDEEITVAADGEKVYTFTFESMTEDEFLETSSMGRLRFGYVGTHFGPSDFDDAFQEMAEDRDLPDVVNRDAVWQAVSTGSGWTGMADTLTERGNEAIRDIVTDAMREMLVAERTAERERLATETAERAEFGGETRAEIREQRQLEKDIAYDIRPERPYRYSRGRR